MSRLITSFTLEPKVIRALKTKAEQEEVSCSELVNRTLKTELKAAMGGFWFAAATMMYLTMDALIATLKAVSF